MLDVNVLGVMMIFILHSITFFVLCPSRFGQRKTAWIWGSVICSMTVFCFLMMQLNPNFLGLLASFSIAALGISITVFYLSSKSFCETLFLILSYAQAFMVSVFLSGLLSYHVLGGNPLVAAIIRSIFQLGIILCCFFLQSRLHTLLEDVVKGWWSLDLLALLLLLYLSILILQAYADFSIAVNTIYVFLLIAIQFAVYWVFFYTIASMSRAAKAHQADLKSEVLQQQIELMQDSLKNAARLRHDARHHTLQIAEYVRLGDMNALLHYLQEEEQALKEHRSHILCENPCANAILCVYERKAKQAHIKVSLDVTLDQNFAIRDVDLVAILANLFENAIHGCIAAKQEALFIQLHIRRKFNKLVIVISNPCSKDIIMVRGLPCSKTHKGIGISSILHHVETYNGDIDFKIEDGLFVCRILLPYLTSSPTSST